MNGTKILRLVMVCVGCASLITSIAVPNQTAGMLLLMGSIIIALALHLAPLTMKPTDEPEDIDFDPMPQMDYSQQRRYRPQQKNDTARKRNHAPNYYERNIGQQGYNIARQEAINRMMRRPAQGPMRNPEPMEEEPEDELDVPPVPPKKPSKNISKCPICGKEFTSDKLMRRHYGMSHYMDMEV